ncbi:hypothetical protein M2101_000854 [Parabacteroides sp. PM5-20]|uniref:DUF4296 domain-containing protein n=1 Tax=Parabacteroides sp. PM5-20 TaxID=2940527 RepID=UPI002473BE8F|nr:DUF4296 domain-containing protein [Parabacteroides sp. PM5-20]MDH6534192.1 hypothetical protein [Parabacteroides sp. PM5-20]
MQNHKYIYVIVLGGLLFLSGCKKTPKDILSEKDMQKVLTDMLIAESMVGTDYTTYSNDTIKTALFESVFHKHKITQATYDSSLVWYGRNLDIYMKVYDRVIADLKKQIRDLGDVQADAAPTSNRDSVDIWPRRNVMELYPQAVFNGTVFDIKPDKNYASGSTFVLGMRVWGLREGMKHYPEIRLHAVQKDTLITINKTINKDGYYAFDLRTLPTRQVSRVYGSIRMDNAEKSYMKIFVDSLSLMRYNYKPLFQKEVGDLEIQPLSD